MVRSRAEIQKKREFVTSVLTRVFGAFFILAIIYLIWLTGEWPIIVLILYGLYFLLGGRKVFGK